MKNILVLLVSIAFGLTLSAQHKLPAKLQRSKLANRKTAANYFKTPIFKAGEGYYFASYDINAPGWVDSVRFEYSYDQKGNITREDQYDANDEVFYRIELDYDQYDNQVESRTYYSDGTDLQLLYTDANPRIYNSAGKIVQASNFSVGQEGDTSYSYLTDYKYKGDSLIVIYSFYDESTQSYQEDSYREVYTVKNSKGEYTKLVEAEFDGGKYTVDLEYRNITWYKLDFEREIQDYLNANIYQYNELGIAVEMYKLTGTYTASLHTLLAEQKTGLNFMPIYRQKTSFDAFKNQISYSEEYNDGSGFTTDYATKNTLKYQGEFVISNVYSESEDGIDYAFINRRDFSNFKDITGIKTQNQTAVVVYPNPFTDVLTVDNREGAYTRIALIDALGKVCLEQQLTPDANKLNTSLVPSGMYTLVLQGATNSQNLKWMKL